MPTRTNLYGPGQVSHGGVPGWWADQFQALTFLVELLQAAVETAAMDADVAAEAAARAAADTALGVDIATKAPLTTVVGGGVARVNEGPLSLLDPRVNADPTGVVDAAAKAVIARNLLPARGGTIFVPPGTYRWSSTFLVDTKCVIFEGASSGLQPTTGTHIRADAGVNPFHFKTGPGALAAQSALRNLHIVGQDAALGTNDGVLVQCHGMALEHLVVEGFGRHGVYVLSDVLGADDTEKNANNVSALQIRCYQNKSDGFAVYGVNANIGSYIGLDLDTNGGFGLYDRSHLGNDYFGMHLAGNVSGGMRLGNPGSRVHAYGVYYETENKPALQIDLGNSGGNVVAFSTASRADGASAIVDNSITAPNFVFTDEGSPHWTRQIVASHDGAGPAIDQQPDALRMLRGAKLVWQNPLATAVWEGEVHADGRMLMQSAQGQALFLLNPLQVLGNADIYTGHVDIVTAGKVLKVESTQVVGPRGAAVADATDAASAITQLNALLARLRAHGLIAP